jgi:hypothetical protein
MRIAIVYIEETNTLMPFLYKHPTYSLAGSHLMTHDLQSPQTEKPPLVWKYYFLGGRRATRACLFFLSFQKALNNLSIQAAEN